MKNKLKLFKDRIREWPPTKSMHYQKEQKFSRQGVVWPSMVFHGLPTAFGHISFIHLYVCMCVVCVSSLSYYIPLFQLSARACWQLFCFLHSNFFCILHFAFYILLIVFVLALH